MTSTATDTASLSRCSSQLLGSELKCCICRWMKITKARRLTKAKNGVITSNAANAAHIDYAATMIVLLRRSTSGQRQTGKLYCFQWTGPEEREEHYFKLCMLCARWMLVAIRCFGEIMYINTYNDILNFMYIYVKCNAQKSCHAQ